MKNNDIVFNTTKGSVTDAGFIGREEYIKKLTQYMEKPIEQMTHLSIYGLPHVGKTSLVTVWSDRLKKNTEQTLVKVNAIRVNILNLITIQEQDDEGNSFKFLLRNLISAMSRNIKGIICENKYEENLQNLLELLLDSKRCKFVDLKINDAINLLISAINMLSSYGIRTVWILDEFERIQKWDEADYLKFMHILTDTKLNLLCIVVSRPHISYVISNFKRKLMPFESILLKPFSDDDMDEYFKVLNEKKIIVFEDDNRKQIQFLLYLCGRNPYLLSLMAKDLIRINAPDDIYNLYKPDDSNNQYNIHFADVLNFMKVEEEKKCQSLSHIIKCYFSTLDDYRDIMRRFIDIGYIEIIPENSKYALRDDRFTYIDDETDLKYYYTTVSAAFINYLFVHGLVINKERIIKDNRDLLTGLVHILRDIIRYEFSKLWNVDWNEKMVSNYIVNLYNYRKIKILKRNGRNQWRIKTEDDQRHPISDEDMLRIRLHGDELIDISESALKFVMNELNNHSDNPFRSIDPISLKETGNIIERFFDVFEGYFDGINKNINNLSREDFEKFKNKYDNTSDGEEVLLLENILEEIQEFRNSISHFSKHNISRADSDLINVLCIQLLTSILHNRQNNDFDMIYLLMN